MQPLCGAGGETRRKNQISALFKGRLISKQKVMMQ